MLATQRTQSLSDFRQKATQTLDRLNETGEAEILTVNGQARAVLLSPATFDQMMRDAQLNEDVAVVRKALQAIEAGKGMTTDQALSPIRQKLLTMKKTHASKKRK